MKGKQLLPILILAMAGILIGSAACVAEKKKEKVEWLEPDSVINEKLGDRLTSLLYQPKSVKCFAVEWNDSSKVNMLESHYIQGKQLKKLSNDEKAVLKYILISNKENFVNDSIKILSPYRPVLDFEFSNRKEKAHVIISLSDYSWTLIYDGKRQFNYNFQTPDIVRFCNNYLEK